MDPHQRALTVEVAVAADRHGLSGRLVRRRVVHAALAINEAVECLRRGPRVELEVIGKTVVGKVLVGEERVATDRWDGDAEQAGRHRGESRKLQSPASPNSGASSSASRRISAM